MKRTMSVMGHLGADPETKTTKNGIAYTTFRIANTAYGDAEGQTTWITVTVWDPSKQKLCNTLKKGSCVEVEGDYSDRTYTSTKTGQIEIGRDIIATAIYFGPSRKDDSEQAQASSSATAATAPTAVATPTKAKVAKAPAPVAPAPTMPSDDDDLPF